MWPEQGDARQLHRLQRPVPNAGPDVANASVRSRFRTRALRLVVEHVLEIVVRLGKIGLAGADPAAHRDAGLVHGLGTSRHQPVPPVEIAALGDQPVGAGAGQPADGAHILRRQPDAVRNARQPVGIVRAAAAFARRTAGSRRWSSRSRRCPRPRASTGSICRSRRRATPTRPGSSPPASWFSRTAFPFCGMWPRPRQGQARQRPECGRHHTNDTKLPSKGRPIALRGR